MSQVSSSVQRGEALLIPLIDLSPIVQQMMDHVQLLVCRGKVDRCACTVILGDEVRVSLHDLGELLRVTEADRAVERDRRILGDRRVPVEESNGAVSLRAPASATARPDGDLFGEA